MMALAPLLRVSYAALAAGGRATPPPRPWRTRIVASAAEPRTGLGPGEHRVSGLLCTAVPISIDVHQTILGGDKLERIDVTVVEASRASQDAIVNSALAIEGDDTPEGAALTSGDPYGAVLWPAGAAVAEYLFGGAAVSQSGPLHGQTLLELGAGTGLLSLAAASAGFSRVIATDYERLTLEFLSYAAEHLNEDVPAGVIETAVLDFCDEDSRLPAADVVVAADVLYYPASGAMLARRVLEALENGSRVIVGDSPDRPGRAAFEQQLDALLPGVGVADLWVAVEADTCSGHRHELICGKGSKSVPSEAEGPSQFVTVSILDLSPRVLRVL